MLDLATLGLIFNNLEGLAFGPWSGLQRPLLMVADDGDPLSTNQLVAFNVTFDEGFPAAAPIPATPALLLAGLVLMRHARLRPAA